MKFFRWLFGTKATKPITIKKVVKKIDKKTRK